MKRNTAFLIILAFSISIFASGTTLLRSEPETGIANTAERVYTNCFVEPESDFVKKMIASMNLRDKIAQMIIASTIPENFTESSSEFKRIKKLCTDSKVGGFIFFKGSASDYASLSNKLQGFSETPLLISADFERGPGMRVTDGSLFPNNMAIGATGNNELAYKMGLLIANETRHIGILQNYAPDCDVNNNPRNPIINVRSFGEDPLLVSNLSAAMIKGLQEGKVISTAKHFPGHGDTEIDSHNDLPVLNFDMDRLNSIELVPFKNAIANNVMSVMIAHLSFPVLETGEHIPASLSSKIVNGLLIDNLGFKGLVVTDALNMKGITKYFNTAEVALMCVNAGIDLILMPADEEKTITAIENAVNKGTIEESRIDRSVEKILKAKEWGGLFENKYINENEVAANVNNDKSKKLAQQIADESVTLVKDDNNTVPFKIKNPKILVLCMSDGKENINSSYFISQMKDKFTNAEISEISTEISESDANDILGRCGNYDYVVAGVFAKIKFGTGKISILPSQSVLLTSIAGSGAKLVTLSFGNPYLLNDFPAVPNYMCLYGDANVSINAAIKSLLGENKITGKLPVSINEKYNFGKGIVR